MRNMNYRLLLAVVAFSQGVSAQQSDQITQDPQTGDYHVTYSGEDNAVHTVTLPSAKRVEPVMGSSFKAEKDDTISYRYLVANRKTAPKSIVSVRIDPVLDIVSGDPSPQSLRAMKRRDQIRGASQALQTPPDWQGTVAPSRSGGLRVSWGQTPASYTTGDFTGIPPGRHVSGFGFRSPFLPGIGIAQFENDTPIVGWPDEGPDLDSPIHAELNRIETTNYVTRLAGVPAIAISSPFSASQVLTELRTQVQGWPAQNLMNAATASEVDNLLSSALANIATGNVAGARKSLQDVGRLVSHGDQHDHDGDDESDDHAEGSASPSQGEPMTDDPRLAARILSFDVKFIEKRLGGGDDK